MAYRYILAGLAYFLASFPIAYFWHLVWFKDFYDELQIYREDFIMPLGLITMILQSILFSWCYPRLFAQGGWLRNSIIYALFGGLVSMSYTTLPVAAKFPMTSPADFVMIEGIYSFVQWAIVAPLIAGCFHFKSQSGSLAIN